MAILHAVAIPDFYAILEVSEQATQEEIKVSYRHLARRYHPDHNPGQEERFRTLHEAYKVLSDAQKRRDYDISRRVAAKGGRAGIEEYTGMEVEATGKQLGRILREVLRQGNMTRVKVRYQGEEILDLPLSSAAFVGGTALVLAPILAVLGGIGLSQVLQISLKNQFMEDFEEATRLHEANQLQAARKLYLKVLDRSEFFLPAYLQLGQLYRQLGENENAVGMFNKVLQLMPFGEVGQLAREQLQQIRGY